MLTKKSNNNNNMESIWVFYIRILKRFWDSTRNKEGFQREIVEKCPNVCADGQGDNHDGHET